MLSDTAFELDDSAELVDDTASVDDSLLSFSVAKELPASVESELDSVDDSNESVMHNAHVIQMDDIKVITNLLESL